jgi:hypothetical protein
MKIELTDTQVSRLLDELSTERLLTYLARNKSRTFAMIVKLIGTELNSERYITELKKLLDKIPIQKELF